VIKGKTRHGPSPEELYYCASSVPVVTTALRSASKKTQGTLTTACAPCTAHATMRHCVRSMETAARSRPWPRSTRAVPCFARAQLPTATDEQQCGQEEFGRQAFFRSSKSPRPGFSRDGGGDTDSCRRCRHETSSAATLSMIGATRRKLTGRSKKQQQQQQQTERAA
jgi:hypothetical protein